MNEARQQTSSPTAGWSLVDPKGPSRRPDRPGSAPASSVAALAVAFLIAAAPGVAEELRGRVVDPQGAVVANAEIRLFDRSVGLVRTTLSSADGAFALSNLPPGVYLVESDSRDATLGWAQEITLDGDMVLDLPMALRSASTEVVVTASSTPIALQDVGKALDVLSADQIALRNEYSLAEALRTMPGTRIQQLRGPGSLVTVQTRGTRSYDTAVLIDGLRFRDSAAVQGDATAFLQDMTLVNTDRVEFLRGSSSTLYGSNAIGGVVNVTSSQGGGRPHGELLSEGGGLGLLRGVARAGGSLRDNQFNYSGGISHVNVTRGYRGGSPYRNSSVHGSAQYFLKPNLTLSARVWGADAFRTLSESPAFPAEVVANFPAAGNVPAVALSIPQVERLERGEPFDAGASTFVPDLIDPDSRNVSKYLATALVLRHDLSAEGSYQVSYQSVETRRRYQDGPGGPGLYEPLVSNDSRIDGYNHLLQARTDHRLHGVHFASVGYEFESEGFLNFNTDEGPSPTPSQAEVTQSNHAFFAQDQIRLADRRLHVMLSGRWQTSSLHTPQFSSAEGPYSGAEIDSPPSAVTGDAAVAWFVRPTGTKLRAHAGNAFRSPSMYERFGSSYSSFSRSFSYWGDPRLSPERSVATDVGVDQWILGSKARVSGTFYYTDLRETILFDFANFPLDDRFGRFGGYRNSGGGVARGAELTAQIVPGAGTSLQGSYTYTNSEARSPTIGADYFGIPGISNHVYTATATHWFRDRLNVTFDLFAASDYILSPWGANSRRMVFGGPVKADLVVRYEVPVGETKCIAFHAKVENLFNHDYYEDGFASPGAWVIGGIRFQY